MPAKVRRTRKRFAKRKVNKIRKTKVSRPLASRYIHDWKRSTVLFGQGGQISTTLATPTGGGGGYLSIGFNNYVQQLPAYSEWTPLYDMYKLDYVIYKVTWIGSNLTSGEVQTYQAGPPVLYWVIDRDDVTPYGSNAAGLQEIRQNGAVRRHCFTDQRREVTVKFKPSTLSQLYSSAVTTGYSVNFNKWLDTEAIGGSTEVPYFGTKMFFHTPSPNSTPTLSNYFEITATYYVKFKQPR